MDGWVKIHRKMLENPVVCKDNDHLAIWIYLLVNATHKEIPAMFQGRKITLKPGQLVTGRKSIAEQLSVSESKVKRILLLFESDQQIERQRSNQNSLISIVNWNKYQTIDQQNDQQMTSQRPASDQPVTTNKNVKNVRMKELKDLKNKTLYRECVYLTDEEYEKLVLEHGEKFTEDCIELLDNYKGSSGKSYKSDYKAILTWVVMQVKQNMNASFSPQVIRGGMFQESSHQKIQRMRKEAEERERVGAVEID